MSLCDSVIRKYRLNQSSDSNYISHSIGRSSFIRIVRNFINNTTLSVCTESNAETNCSWNTPHYISDHRYADLINWNENI